MTSKNKTGTKASARESLGVVFSWTVGLLAWSVLLGSAMGWIPTVGHQSLPPKLAFALFFVFVVCARVLAIPVAKFGVASLDAGFYIASAVCLGPLYAGILVATALTLDSVWRSLLPGRGKEARRLRLSYIVYFGGVSGGLLMLLAGGFGLDRSMFSETDLSLVLRVLGVGLLFLVVHYAIQALRHALLGQSLKRYARKTLITVMAAEASLLPLAVVVIFLYDEARPLPFAFLGLTYLVLNYGYNRIASVSFNLRKRVAELEILDTSSRHFAASLENADLVSVFAKEIFRAARVAKKVRVYRRQEANDEVAPGWLLEEFERGDEKSASHTLAPPSEIKRIVDEKKALMGRRPHNDELSTGDMSECWMAAPLEVQGEVFGAVAVIGEGGQLFSEEEFKLIQSIAQQGAVALENVRLYELAMFDGLTGLFVRRYFDARLTEEYERAMRFGTEFSVVMIDLDDFKDLNDTLGHQAGDEVLRQTAAVVRQELRGVDAAARYGGEEFALILPRTPMADAMNLAERIREQVAMISISREGVERKVTASFGIASCLESGPESAHEIVAFADKALYRAKRAGKNCVELYWPSS